MGCSNVEITIFEFSFMRLYLHRAWSERTLDIAVRWLTRQCGRPQTECRHACMKLSYQLCTLVPGKSIL